MLKLKKIKKRTLLYQGIEHLREREYIKMILY